MRRARPAVCAVAVLALGACAVAPPTGPSVLAVPGEGKTFAQFQVDEANCRNYAQLQLGPYSPARAANDSAVGSAAVGTLLGAAAGAAIGAAAGNVGAGAAIGAGSGLVLGTGVGAQNAAASAGALQQRYDFAYIQCMTGNGERVQPPVVAAAGYPGYEVGYPPPYAYPGYAYGPPVSLGFEFGGGWGHRYRHW